MNNLKKVVAVQDDGSNWYVIPSELKEEFRKLDEWIFNAYHNVDIPENVLIDLESKFTEKFSKYRTGGDLNNIQLYAEI